MNLCTVTLLVVCAATVSCGKPPWREGEVVKGHRKQKLLKMLCSLRPNSHKCEKTENGEYIGTDTDDDGTESKSNKGNGNGKKAKEQKENCSKTDHLGTMNDVSGNDDIRREDEKEGSSEMEDRSEDMAADFYIDLFNDLIK